MTFGFGEKRCRKNLPLCGREEYGEEERGAFPRRKNSRLGAVVSSLSMCLFGCGTSDRSNSRRIRLGRTPCHRLLGNSPDHTVAIRRHFHIHRSN